MKAQNGSKKFLAILSKIAIIAVVLFLLSLISCTIPPASIPPTYSNLNQRKEFLQSYYKTSYILKIQNFPYECNNNLIQNENDYFIVVDSIGKAHYVELHQINPLNITSDFIINK